MTAPGTSADILADYKATVRMLREAAERYQRAQAEAVELQATIAGLGIEKERLLKALEASVAFEEGLGTVTVEGAPEPLTGAVGTAGTADVDHGG